MFRIVVVAEAEEITVEEGGHRLGVHTEIGAQITWERVICPGGVFQAQIASKFLLAEYRRINADTINVTFPMQDTVFG